jgi:hypothetical protein
MTINDGNQPGLHLKCPTMTVALYKKYLNAFGAITPTGRPMIYKRSNVLGQSGEPWTAYGLMCWEFSRALANIINRMTDDVPRLAAWSNVVAWLSEEDRRRANLEFIDPLGIVAVSRPWVIRSRFVFAAAHLCHQANKIEQGNAWRDDLPMDKEITMQTAKQAGAAWSGFRQLEHCLEEINGLGFDGATGNFRRMYNHRLSLQFAFGVSDIVTRNVDLANNRLTYGLGGIEPLNLGKLVSLLTVERDRCYRAFDAFQDLVVEHEAAMANSR